MARREGQSSSENRKKRRSVTITAALIAGLFLITSTLIGILIPKFIESSERTPILTETSTLTPAPTSTSIPAFTTSSTETPTSIVITSLCPTPTTSLPKNAELTKCAWDFFNAGVYDKGIAAAEECIDQFESQALQQQQEFTASGSPTPPIGKPANDSIRDETLERGPLNDVATCYFIKGWSLEKLNRISEAKETYMGSQQFPDARTWDPNGYLFWSPAQEASNRASRLP